MTSIQQQVSPASPPADCSDADVISRQIRPIAFVNLLPLIIKAAKECGYAIGIHGSLQRDLDLIAVPWTEEAVEMSEIVERVEKACGGFQLDRTSVQRPYWTEKPHGRKAYRIELGASVYLDLSVLPRQNKELTD